MNPSSHENWLRLAVLDLLLAGLGLIFVARTALRHLAANIKPRRRHEN